MPLVSVAFIIGGGQSVYTGLKNRNPTEIDIDSLIAKKPSAEWLKITGGALDTTNAAYTSSFGVGEAKSIFVPLVPPKTDSTEAKIHVLVLTKDENLVKFTNEARQFEKSNTSQAGEMEFLLKNLDKLKVARPVQGLVQFGIDANDKQTRKIRKLYTNLAEDAIIIEEGKSPSAGTGVVMLTAGLVLGGVLLLSSGEKQTPATGAPPPPLPPSAAS